MATVLRTPTSSAAQTDPMETHPLNPSLASDCRDISQHVQNKSSNARHALTFDQSFSARSFRLSNGSADSAGCWNCCTSWGRLTEYKVAFLTAGRTLLEGEEGVFHSDRAVFALRISMIANYSGLQFIGAVAGSLFWSVIVYAQVEVLSCITFGAYHVLLSCLAHAANRFAWMKQRKVFAVQTVGQIVGNLLFPLFVQIYKCNIGWHWAGATFIWMLGAPMGAVVLTDRPAMYGGVTAAVMVLLMVGVMVAFARAAPALTWEGKDTLLRMILAHWIPYWLMPTTIAAMLRWEGGEHRGRLAAQVEQQRTLMGVRDTLQWLIFSIVPARKARELPAISPERWYQAGCDEYPDCTILQMDVSGFTALGSKIGSDELVELIQSLFVSVDYAAECIQCVWKVELIGDCYKAIIGGPQPCQDHAERGVALAYSIVDICRTIAKRLNVNLSVRVGVHSGSVTAAVVGVRMPRYLMFGTDCEVLNLLEIEAEDNSVLLSAATAERVEYIWPHTAPCTLTLPDGTEIPAYSTTEKEKEKTREKEEDGGEGHAGMLEDIFPDLAEFLRGFRSSLDATGKAVSEEYSSSTSLYPAEGLGLPDALAGSVRWQLGASSVASASHSDLETAADSPFARAPSAQSAGASSNAPAARLSLSPLRSLAGSRRWLRSAESAPPAADPDSFHSVRPRFEPSGTILKARIRQIATATSRVAGQADIQRSGSISATLPPRTGLPSMDARWDVSGITVHEIALGTGEWEMAQLLQLSQLLDPEDQAAGQATLLRFQRRIAQIFLLACGVSSVLQIALLAQFGVQGGSSEVAGGSFKGVVTHACFLPAVTLALVLLASTLIALKTVDWWSSGWPQTGASALLFGAALALEGFGGGQKATRWPALLWAFLGVMLQAMNFTSRRWLIWLLVYFVILMGVIVWEWSEGAGMEAVRDVSWWREVLMGWTFAVTTTLCLVPLAFPAMAVLRMQKKAREFLLNTQRLMEHEETLVGALAPPALSRRFLRGDQLVVEGIAEGTSMFAYLIGYEAAVLRHGATATIAWVNAIYEAIDAEINFSRKSDDSLMKVESFNNFVLVFSTSPHKHVRVCLSLAVRILHAVRHISRPDGSPTELKIGVSSGSFTTGIIGLQSPRFSIFGDTVNTASRMASTSQPTTALDPFVQVSPNAFALIGQDGLEEWLQGLGTHVPVRISERSQKTAVKGKGLMQTFCLQASVHLSVADDPAATA